MAGEWLGLGLFRFGVALVTYAEVGYLALVARSRQKVTWGRTPRRGSL